MRIDSTFESKSKTMKTFLTLVGLLTLGLSSTAQGVFTDENGKKGIRYKSGEILVEATYDYIEKIAVALPLGVNSRKNIVQDDLSKKYAMVKLNGKYGLINYKGEEILPVTCDYVMKEMSTDSILVFRPEKSKWSFIDLKTKEVVNTSYDGIETFHEGMAVVDTGDQNLGFIDTSGELIIPANYRFAKGFSEGIARVSNSGDYGYINKAGEPISNLEFDHATHFSHGVGIINKGGKWLEDPMLFVGGKWGLIDKAGNAITAIEYDHVGAFIDDSLIFVNKGRYFNKDLRRETGGKFTILNYKTGVEITPYFRADDIGFSKETPQLLVVIVDGKYGLIDLEGNEITPVKYTYLGSFEDDYFIARIGKDRYRVAPNGEEIKLED